MDRMSPTSTSESRSVGRRRASVWAFPVVAAVIALAVLGNACGRAASQRTTVVQVPDARHVTLFPPLYAGYGGWCLTLESAPATECPTFNLPPRSGPFAGPIVAEVWDGGGGYYGAGAYYDEVQVLTASDVSAVSLEGRSPIATQGDPALPDHMRTASIKLLVAKHGQLPRPFPHVPVTALDGQGHVIAATRAPGPPLESRTPVRSLHGSKPRARGACTIEGKNIPGLILREGRVVLAVEPHPDVRGREFVDCASNAYLLDGWVIEAHLLLDAAHPGSTPAMLPGMSGLAGHHAVFARNGAASDLIARRIPGAWLVVTKGKDEGQRLRLLEGIRAADHA
jgi:hypothetical protein